MRSRLFGNQQAAPASKVTRRVVTHLSVVFDAEIIDPATSAVVYTRPVAVEFNDGSEGGGVGKFEDFSFPAARVTTPWVTFNLRIGGQLWFTAPVEIPAAHRLQAGDSVMVRPYLHLSLAQWDELLTMADAA